MNRNVCQQFWIWIFFQFANIILLEIVKKISGNFWFAINQYFQIGNKQKHTKKLTSKYQQRTELINE